VHGGCAFLTPASLGACRAGLEAQLWVDVTDAGQTVGGVNQVLFTFNNDGLIAMFISEIALRPHPAACDDFLKSIIKP
jgi:hypothetical protein